MANGFVQLTKPAFLDDVSKFEVPELVTGQNAALKEAAANGIRNAFKAMDVDGDGKITVQDAVRY